MKTIDVYMGKAGETLDAWPGSWVYLGSGPVEFTTSERTITLGANGEDMEEKLYDSEIFADWVRESHRIPNIRTEPELLRQLNVTAYGYSLRSGQYMLEWFEFADGGSYWYNEGKWRAY